MQLFVTVQVIQTHEEFSHDDCYVFLWNRPRLNQVTAAASRAKLHDDPQVRPFKVGSMIFRYVRRAQLREY